MADQLNVSGGWRAWETYVKQAKTQAIIRITPHLRGRIFSTSWPFCDHPGGLWVSLATCLRGFCSAPVYLFYQEGGSVSVCALLGINKDKWP